MLQSDQSQQENQTKEHNKIIGNTYNLINIGPINNDFLIPTKIKSPFEEEPDLFDQDIENIIDPYFSEKPPNCFPIHNFSLLLQYISLGHREKICNFIIQRIISFSSKNSKELLSLTEKSLIILNVVDLLTLILNFSNFFEFVQIDRPFSEIFYEILHKEISNDENFIKIVSSIVSEIFINSLKNNKPLSHDEQYVILFIENTNLLTNFFVDTISQTLSDFFKEIIIQNNEGSNMKERYCLLFQSFHILYSSLPKSTSNFSKLISRPFTINVIGQKADDFISSVGELVFYNQDQINTFFAVIDPSTPITDYTAFVKSMVSDGINMQKVANLHRFIGKQSIHMRHIIERFLKKRLLDYEKQAIISFTKLIDQEFRSGKYSPDLISELSLIQDKFCFESAHSVLMMRRAIDTDFELDKRFAEEYSDFYNDNHSENFMLIVKDVEESRSLFRNFLNENKEVPSFLTIHVFFFQNWKHYNFDKYRFPDIIQPYIDNFTLFLREKYPKKKLNWRLDASDCTLKIGSFTIKCNGITGFALLALNDSPKTAEQIKVMINSDIDIDAILSQFLDQKGGCIVTKCIENKQFFYKINTDVIINHENDDEKLITTQLSYPEERNLNPNMYSNFYNVISKRAQIDGIIMSSLKEREMSKQDIISMIRELVTFPVDENVIQERIDYMEKRNFISHDANNDDDKYHYLA